MAKVGEAPLLEIRGVWRAFGGIQAVRGVSLRLSPGEVCAVIGPNGAGKTTLFNLLTGHLSCDRGAVLFKGDRISGLPPHRIWRRGISHCVRNLDEDPEATDPTSPPSFQTATATFLH